MRFIRHTTFLLLVVIRASSQSAEFSGRVLDSETQQPLPFANVFINSTTLGTSADSNGEFILRKIPAGTHDLIFSFVGYQSFQVKISFQDGTSIRRVIQLLPSKEQLSEIQVTARRDKEWEKQLRKFRKVFLGDVAESACRILNPEVISFTEDSKTLLASAPGPIEIQNEHLGYRLMFYLKKFRYAETEYEIIGNTLFKQLPPSDEKQAELWLKNREVIYLSSLKHFFKSVIDKRISAEGFKVYEEKNPQRTSSFSGDFQRKTIISLDTVDLVSQGSSLNELNITLKGKTEIHFLKEHTQQYFYRDIPYAVSWIEVRGGRVRVNREGTLLNPTDIIVSGDMTVSRVAKMLPLDYSRTNLITVKSVSTSRAKRLEEKVYVQTDKPYYYTRDDIWLSAFLNYRTPVLTDSLSKVLYVDLIDSARQVVSSSILKIDSGRAIGKITLPQTVRHGNYVLRAYTQWMRNYGNQSFFYKPLPLLNSNQFIRGNSNEPAQESDLEIEMNKPEFQRRDHVTLRLHLKNDEGRAIKGTLSISVVETDVAAIRENPTIIKGFAFQDRDERLENKFSFPIERGITVAGIAVDKKSKSRKKVVTVIQDKFEGIYQTSMDDEGRFKLPNLIFFDSTRFAVQADAKKIKFEVNDKPSLPNDLPKYKIEIANAGSTQRLFSDYSADKGVILLKEVEVSAQKITDGRGYSGLYGKPDWAIKSEKLQSMNANLASAIEMLLPGYRLGTDQGHYLLTWTRSNFMAINSNAEPALFIDNVQFIGAGETVGDRLYSINTSMVDHIEVSSMASSQMGANNSFGAIWVFMKRDTPENFKSLPVLKVRGFDSPHLFQSPDYGSANNTDRPDLRTTLYWNPRLNLTSIDGVASVSFYTSSLTGQYKIVVEGVSEKNIPFRAVKYFKVN